MIQILNKLILLMSFSSETEELVKENELLKKRLEKLEQKLQSRSIENTKQTK